MSAKLIFKMELFKYMKDKKYLISTGILAIINICSTIYITYLIDAINDPTIFLSTFFGLFSIFFSLSFFANFVFMFLYPFHLMAMDYKNDVMAMLMASGVNRTKLFFSKIGATLLWSIGVTFILVFIPSFIVLLKVTQTAELMAKISNFFNLIGVFPMGLLGFSFSILNNYINVLILISSATILMKGRNLTILIYFVFSALQAIIVNFFDYIPVALDFSNVGYSIFNNLVLIICSFVMVIISLNIMKRQNL